MHGPSFLPIALILLLLFGDNVLITRKGEKIEGPVAREGGEYVVQTVTGPRRFPESEVALVFESLRDVTQRADERFREAKRLYEEASRLEESNPTRNQKLALAMEIAQGAVATYQHLQPHYGGASHSSIPNSIQVMLQFIRLCRGASTSDVAAGAAGGRAPTAIVLEETAFVFTPPHEGTRPWVVTGDLGSGLNSAAQDLAHVSPERRLAAVKRLTHPPSPLHLSGLLKLLETEQDPKVLLALSEGLAFMDTPAVLKSLGWAKKETDPARRELAFAVLRGSGDRAAFEFLAAWFEEAPPATHPDRAAFASAFRQFHGLAVPHLKELLTRNRSPRLQTESIRQLGVIGDKAAGPMLLKTLGPYTKDSAISLLKLGKPAIPTLMEGARSHESETRRICLYFLRKLTGVQQQNMVHFETWWNANRKTVLEEEKSWWEDQGKKDWPVAATAFSTYDLPMESIVP